MKEGKRMSNKTGEMLKKLRKERGVTLQVVADAIGCSPSYLHRLENNSRKNPSICTATKLAAFYDIDVSLLNSNDQMEIDCALIKVAMKQEIADELDTAIGKVKEGLVLFNQNDEQSKKAFIEVQKSLLYIQSLT